MRYLLTLLFIFGYGQVTAQTLITPGDAPIVVYQAEADYEDIKENLETAIIDRGMIISSTLHISDMFTRTAKDLGLQGQPYSQAESLEFCNVLLSHQMSSAHPANLAICPLTIGLYTTPELPGQVFVTYRRPQMLGEAAKPEAALTKLLEEIIAEALE